MDWRDLRVSRKEANRFYYFIFFFSSKYFYASAGMQSVHEHETPPGCPQVYG